MKKNFEKSKVSICIPYFLVDQRDVDYLHELLYSLKDQRYTNYEVVLSEDSASPITLDFEYIKKSLFNSMQIRLVKSPSSGISNNSNFAVGMAKSKYVKIMFQDDFFAHANALGEIVNALEVSPKKWLICSSNHYNQESGKFGPSMTPRLRKLLFSGINTVSSPSVVAFHAESFLRFSESISLMMDCEWYVRMVHNHGRPKVLKKIAIINRLHSNQAQHSLRQSLKDEVELVRKLHSKGGMRKSKCSCSIF